jgi:hypothetical protein
MGRCAVCWHMGFFNWTPFFRKVWKMVEAATPIFSIASCSLKKLWRRDSTNMWHTLHTCDIHDIHYIHTCDIHDIQYTCDIHIWHTLHTCDIHDIHYTHVIYMTYITHIRYTWHILHTCDIHGIHTLHTCDIGTWHAEKLFGKSSTYFPTDYFTHLLFFLIYIFFSIICTQRLSLSREVNNNNFAI